MTTAIVNEGVTFRRITHEQLRHEVADAVAELSGLTIDEFERLGNEGRLEGELRDLWRLVRDAL